MERWIGLTAIVILGAACTGTSSVGGSVAATEPVPSTSTVTSTSTSSTSTTLWVPVPDLESPSQSPEDAARDGVIPELAELPLPIRFIPSIRAVGTAEGFWVLGGTSSELIAASRDAACLLGNVDGDYPTEVICTTEYGELLLFDNEARINRAYPMPSAVPTWLLLTEEYAFVGHVGDGGNPSSVIGRIDRTNLESTFLVFGGDGQDWPPLWHLVEPSLYEGIVEPSPIWEEPPEGYTYADSWTGTIWINVVQLESVFASHESTTA